jgi:hypothetical protein
MDRMRFAGEWCTFRWFQAYDLTLDALVVGVPQLVHDRVVVVSSCDSGPLRLAPEEMEAGWLQLGPLAVSPRASAPRWLPQGGWDEWYVFEDVPPARSPEVFVNYSPFSLRPEPDNECQQAAIERFWGQVAEWWPESYLAEGDSLICVTRAEAVIPALERVFEVVRS